jgi:hypothetical protein
MIDSNWRKPTNEEMARGYIAMQRETFFCQMDNGRLLEVGYTGKKQEAAWFGYTAQMIERRISWGGDLPAWIEVRKGKKAA